MSNSSKERRQQRLEARKARRKARLEKGETKQKSTRTNGWSPTSWKMIRPWNWFKPKNRRETSSVEGFGMFTQGAAISKYERACTQQEFNRLEKEGENSNVHPMLKYSKAKRGLILYWVGGLASFGYVWIVLLNLLIIGLNLVYASEQLSNALELDLVQKVAAVGGDHSLVLADNDHTTLPPGAFETTVPVSRTFSGPFYYEAQKVLCVPLDLGSIIGSQSMAYIGLVLPIFFVTMWGIRAFNNQRLKVASLEWLTFPMKALYGLNAFSLLLVPVAFLILYNI